MRLSHLRSITFVCLPAGLLACSSHSGSGVPPLPAVVSSNQATDAKQSAAPSPSPAASAAVSLTIPRSSVDPHHVPAHGGEELRALRSPLPTHSPARTLPRAIESMPAAVGSLAGMPAVRITEGERHSISDMPARISDAQRHSFSDMPVRISDTERHSFSDLPLHERESIAIVNGSRIRIVIPPSYGMPITVIAGSVPLVLRMQGPNVEATGRFNDTANPPGPSSEIVITYAGAREPTIVRYGVSVLHE